jgi:hypothetical protein
MYGEILKAFVSGAGGKIGSRIMEMFDEQTARAVRIEEKVDKIYESVMALGLRQRLLFFNERKVKLLSNVSLYKSFLKESGNPSKENLDNIAKLFVATDPNSFMFHVNSFVTEIIGAKLEDGIHKNSFRADPQDFKKGVLFEYAGTLLVKEERTLDDFLDLLADFAALFVYDLNLLSEAYSLAYQILKKAGVTDRPDTRLDIEPRWFKEDGLAKDLMPLLAEGVRFVAGPSQNLHDAIASKWRSRPAAIIMRHNNWKVENQDRQVFTGWSADTDKPGFGMSPHDDWHLWYVQKAQSKEYLEHLSLAGGSYPSKVLTLVDNGSILADPGDSSRVQEFKPIVMKQNKDDGLQWFKLRTPRDFHLIASMSLANRWHMTLRFLRKVYFSSSYLAVPTGDDLRQFAFTFWQDRLFTGEYLKTGQKLYNLANGRYEFYLSKRDGLAVYDKGAIKHHIWKKPDNLTIDDNWRVYVGMDGLHIYSGSRALVDTPLPAVDSKTPQNFTCLRMQDDDNLVLYAYKGDGYTATAAQDKFHPIKVQVHP